ncbi:histone H3-like centromeric protein cid [Drosophila santomea]|uniref:histone H3-like centromeric protein cid n=1 Tax=Drosophila santomea TaxID=129105 RepID=UPI001953F705|nr:histone H3-like centromeric protein cid [Drosophila santomea]
MPRHGNAKRGPKSTVNNSRPQTDDDTCFRSPEPEDGTDYGLEFTTSQQTQREDNSRRSSTMRKDAERRHPPANRTSTSDEGDDEDQENRGPAAASTRSRRMTVRPETRTRAPRPVAAQNQNQTRQRKMRNPISRTNRLNREILRLQNHPGTLIPKLPFARLVREFIVKYSDEAPLRVTEGALIAMQESCEMFLTQRLEDSYMLTKHRNRVTLEVRDMALMAYICDRNRSS